MAIVNEKQVDGKDLAEIFAYTTGTAVIFTARQEGEG
jgi:hypothetical protein